MEPFTLRVDWTCWDAYGDPVEVEIHRQPHHPRLIHTSPDPSQAAGWARDWVRYRGLDFTCDIDRHQSLGHKHVELHVTRRSDTP